jgi:hypothetical protein
MLGGQALPPGMGGPAGGFSPPCSGVYAPWFRSSSGTAGLDGERLLLSARVGSVGLGGYGAVGWVSVVYGVGRGATRGLL